MVDLLRPTSPRSTSLSATQKVEQKSDLTTTQAKPAGPVLPRVKAEFEPNEAFADFDATMSQAVATLRAVISTAPFNGAIKDEQLAELAAGKLAGKPLTAGMASLQNVAKLLTTSPEGKVFKAQLGAPINAKVLEVAPQVAFPKAHEAMLKERLSTYANALCGPLKDFVDPKTKLLKLDQLHVLLESGVIGGKKLTELVPDKAARDAVLDAAGMLTDNRRLFEAVGTMSTDQLKKLVSGAPVAVNDGQYKWTVGLADVVATTNPPRPPPEPTVDVNDPQWKSKLPLLVSEYDAFIKSRKMVPLHEAWHGNPKNGSGGVTGPGSGEWFLQFHAHMAADFTEFLKMRGTADQALLKGQLPMWGDMTKDIPDEFKEGKKKNIGWKLPPFLQTKADQTKSPLQQNPQPFKLDGRVIKSLDDIKSMDELGRVLGESGAHAVAHVQLGGPMAGFKSVAEHAFVLWHYGTIEKVRNQWLSTDAGKQWAAANPGGWSKPFLDAHDEVMHDVVDRVTKAESAFQGPATRSGPSTVSRGAAATQSPDDARRAQAQVVRKAKKDAEDLCATRYVSDAVVFKEEHILEAASGLVDQTQKTDGEVRTKKKRAAAAAPPPVARTPWQAR